MAKYPQKITPIISLLILILTGGACWLTNQSKPNQTNVFSLINSALAQTTPAPTTPKPNPQEIILPGEVRSLPGQLDQIPLFNSNSPEWVKQGGILLSTFPPTDKTTPAAHLNYRFNGKFNLFAHHFSHTPPNLQTLYIGIIVNNPTAQPVTVDILEAASYLMEPEAPFAQKPTMSDNPDGSIYSGPGIRAVDNVLRGIRQDIFPAQIVIPAGASEMLMNLPIPVRGLARAVNGRSTFMRLNSSGPVYVASLAMFGASEATGDRPPTLEEWEQLLNTGNFAMPRDKIPTPLEQTTGQLIYGRVAGVQAGSNWVANLVDAGKDHLQIPGINQNISYAISTLPGGRLGTGQTQAGEMLSRYPDTAYLAHANYGVHYDLTLPLFNPTAETRTISLTLSTPQKEEKLSKGGLIFRQPSWDFPFFRGTVRLRYTDDQGEEITRYLHLWQRRGQIVEPLVKLQLNSQEKRNVRLDFIYPPDSVPPQVLTVKTIQ